MYLISIRNKLDDGKNFSDTDHIFELQKDHSINEIQTEELASKIKNKRVLLLIHGFNNRRSHILNTYLTIDQKIMNNLNQVFNHVIGFIWPGGESRFDYFDAKRNTRRAGERFRHILTWLNLHEATVDIMGHSMASLVGRMTLLSSYPLHINNIYSFGSAITKEAIVKHDEIRNAIKRTNHFYVFVTQNDSLLKYGFRLIEWKSPIGYKDGEEDQKIMKNLDKITIVDCTEVIKNHTGYKDSDEIYRFIAETIDKTPADEFLKLTSS